MTIAFKKTALLAAGLGLYVLSCTCTFEFTYDGVVLEADGGAPVEGAFVATASYDLYAVDPEDNNSVGVDAPNCTDSTGFYHVRCFGVYDCGLGRIECPRDLGVVYLHVEKEGYVPVDTFFSGVLVTNQHLRHNRYELPTVYLERER